MQLYITNSSLFTLRNHFVGHVEFALHVVAVELEEASSYNNKMSQDYKQGCTIWSFVSRYWANNHLLLMADTNKISPYLLYQSL